MAVLPTFASSDPTVGFVLLRCVQLLGHNRDERLEKAAYLNGGRRVAFSVGRTH
jgi:hypothetical protein